MADEKKPAEGTTTPAGDPGDPKAIAHGADAVRAGAAAARGAKDGDDIGGSEDEPKGDASYRVLHTIDHDMQTHLPGEDVTLPKAAGEALVAAGHLASGSKKEKDEAEERADAAREAARAGV